MIWVCVIWSIVYIKHIKSFSLVTANDFYSFKNAWATSTYVDSDGNLEEFSPLRVIQPGPTYWCSSGSHSVSDIVSWTGEFTKQPLIESLTIDWTYAPKEFQISASPDGINYTSLMPFQPTMAEKSSFTQFIKLPMPFLSKELKISMKDPQDNFFGISSVKIRAGGNPMFMLKSGITSSGGELCLVNKNDKPLLLNCLEAIAESSGIELWRFNSNQQLVSISQSLSEEKCLAVPVNSSNLNLPKGTSSHIYEVYFGNCEDLLDQDDAFSRWNFESNSQISLLSPLLLCLSQVELFPPQNNQTLVSNINITNFVQVDIKSVSIKSHEAELAIDNKLDTYWASPPLESSNTITINLILKDTYLIDSIVIYWEYPAFSYLFKTSLDGVNFTVGAYNASNGSTKTIDLLGIETKYLQLVLLHPHINYKVKNIFVYGIREIQIMSNATRTVVENCKIAANSSDARDKYFVDYVTQYDPNMAKNITSLESNLVELSNGIFDNSEYLTEKTDYLHDSLSQLSDYSDSLEQINKFMNQARDESMFDNYTKSLIGESKNFPADSCKTILTHNKNAKSGFYYLNPTCSPITYRAYCHFHQNESRMILIKHANISQSSSISNECAKYGLEPLIINDKLDYDSLLASTIAFGVVDFIPLARDYHCQDKCSGEFYDLFQGIENMTGILQFNSSTSPGPFDDLAGLTSEGIVYKKSSNININHVACTSSNGYIPDFTTLLCDDVLIGNERLLGEINTSIYVECPSGCQHSNHPVYGSNYVFTETSSICKAAIDSGIILDGGRFVISIEGPIQVTRDDKIYDSRLSFRINQTTKKCPIDLINSKHSINHVHKRITHDLSHNFDSFFSEIKPTDHDEVDPWTEKLSKISVDHIDSLYGIDSQLVSNAVEESIISVDKFNSKFKKVVRDTRKTFKTASDYLDRMRRLYDDLEVMESDRGNKLSDVDNTRDDRHSQLSNTPVFAEFRFESLDNMSISLGDMESWRLYDTVYKSVAGYLAHYPKKSEKSDLSILLIKSHVFFNFKFDFLISSLDDKICGVVFRFLDNFNYTRLVFDTENGETRLERVNNGREFILFTVKNGGLRPENWTRVSVIARGSLIEVVLFKNKIMSVLDESAISGSIGLLSIGDSYYSNIKIDLIECNLPDEIKHLDIRCSNFKEEYLGDFNDAYDIVSFTNDNDFRGWHYSGNMIVQTSPFSITESMALLSHNRTCKSGVFNFTVWPERKIHEQRPPSVGAVFSFSDDKNFAYLSLEKDSIQLISRKDGIDSTIAKVDVDYTYHRWHVVSIRLDETVSARVDTYEISGKIPISGNRIGIFVRNVARVLFKDLQLHDEIITLLLQKENTKVWGECLSDYHGRINLCNEIKFDCNNFCPSCCRHYTSLLSSNQYDECMNDCNRIQIPIEDTNEYNKYIESCSPLHHHNKSYYNHCKNDYECMINACLLCCESGSDKYLQPCYKNCTRWILTMERNSEL